MKKKSIIAILSAVVLMVVVSLALVFTIGPKTSAAGETVYLVPFEFLNLTNNGKTLGDYSYNGGNAFNADGKAWITEHAKYRVKIPAGVTSIGHDAFSNCRGLTNITIPEGVISIGEYAFSGCSSLTSITIPESVTSIDSYAFAFCSGLTSITVDLNNKIYTSRDKEGHEVNAIIGQASNTLIQGCQNTVIPNSVTTIVKYAFRGCSGLTSITIPSSVTSIGDNAFQYCSGLNEIIVRNLDLMTNTYLQQQYASKLHYGAEQNAVTFNTMGGNAVDNQIINFGDFASEPNPEKEGYHVTGWYSDEQYTQPFTFDTPIKYDITLYAKWEENPTVTFMVDGIQYSSETVEYNTAVSVPTEPTKTGYTFIGWYRNNAAYDFNTLVTENITLTAKWKENPKITFMVDGIEYSKVVVVYNTAVSVPTEPTKTGYTFMGWYRNNAAYDFNTLVTENITLTAKWQINQYTVEFWWQNGTHTGSQTVDYGTPVQRPTDPTKEGYTFVGWFTDDLYQHPYDFNTPVTEDFGLFAQWTINQYTVTFDSKQGSSVLPQTVNWNTKISRPSDPVREGYDFMGWYNGDAEYDFNTPVTSNMTLTAKWKSNNPDFSDDPADPTEENPAVNNQNNDTLIWGIAGVSAGILIIGGIVFGIVISKRRRK